MAMDLRNERRRFRRYSGGQYPLRVGRHAARLINWSPAGIGVGVNDGVGDYAVGERVAISVHSEQTHGVALFSGRVMRVDALRRTVGIDFVAGQEDAAGFLIELVANGVSPSHLETDF